MYHSGLDDSPKPNYDGWFRVAGRGNKNDEDPQFPRSSWKNVVKGGGVVSGYWEWVFEQRRQMDAANLATRPASKDDVLRAVFADIAASRTLYTLASELIQEGTEVYWYTQRGSNYYLQEGCIVVVSGFSVSGGTCVKVGNFRTQKEYWISLFDLRFWLNDIYIED